MEENVYIFYGLMMSMKLSLAQKDGPKEIVLT